jgi:hypothetical protein
MKQCGGSCVWGEWGVGLPIACESLSGACSSAAHRVGQDFDDVAPVHVSLHLQAVLRTWLPLSEAVLGMAVSCLPSPPAASPRRIPRLLGTAPSDLPPSLVSELSSETLSQLQAGEAALAASDPNPEAPLVVYVSKMIAVPPALVPRRVHVHWMRVRRGTCTLLCAFLLSLRRTYPKVVYQL